MKPEYTTPFSLADAKAGAPFRADDGRAMRSLIWDRKHPTHPIVMMEEAGEQEVFAFTEDGRNTSDFNLAPKCLVMTPLYILHGKPVWTGDEIICYTGDMTRGPYIVRATDRDFTGCTWPAPAKVYPKTGMTGADLNTAYDSKHQFEEALANVANAAIKHAIDTGAVITKEDQAARDLRVAEAVRDSARNLASLHTCKGDLALRIAVNNIDLHAIIAGVK
jgi:hypothetical protein